MKSLSFLAAALLSLPLISQDIQHGQLTPDAARSNRIKSARVAVIFLSEKDSTKGDTGVVEVQHYDMTGYLTNRVYACTLDKCNYRSTTYYTYHDNGSVKTEVRKELGETVDSTYWYDRDHYYRMTDEPGLKIIRSMEGDSIFKELRITENDSIEVRHKFKPQPVAEKFDGDCNASDYPVHKYGHSGNTDTASYYNNAGSLRLQLISHLDAKGRPTWIEYISCGDINARGFYAKFNNSSNLSDFIPLSPKGKCNYYIVKEYGANGLIKEKRTYSKKKHYTRLKVVYTYETY